ncbi:MAG: [Fe-Fe] hydrogenase large subunit C-terminal domain-containing protein [Spirochaetaceae bacterium]
MSSTPALYPVYTEKADCLDCYKCVRHCPVKAITFENGHARVDHEHCVFCGRCVDVCPAGAKRGRNDVRIVEEALERDTRIILSIAPSWRGEFPGLSTGQLIKAAQAAGFTGVSETALGAEVVSAEILHLIHNTDKKFFVSSACPTVVEYVMKYRRTYAPHVTAILSPMLVHCSMLHEQYGENVSVVFAGPCVSKKREADEHPELCTAALTYSELMELLKKYHIDPYSLDEAGEEKHFLAGRSGAAARYPYEGGMIESIRECRGEDPAADELIAMSISGIEEIEEALSESPEELSGKTEGKFFLELLACRGGCINGSGRICKGTVGKRLSILASAGSRAELPPFEGKMEGRWNYALPTRPRYGERKVRDVLERIGKYTIEDELNCGGCGYNTCREFAAACLDDRAETVMCVSHMRKLAQKKANTIIEKMPSGVVIVDEKLTVLESNYRFAEIIGDDALLMWRASPKLEGALITRLVPFHALFETVLKKGNEIIDRNIQLKEKVLNVTIFPIIKGQSICAIIQDVTVPWINRDNIIKKAREVISKNLETVQQVAYLLGENASENEVILNSIIESFKGGGNE